MKFRRSIFRPTRRPAGARDEFPSRSDPLSVTQHAACRLPGTASGLAAAEANDAYGRRFAFVADPATHAHTVVLECAPAAETGKPVGTHGWLEECERWLTGLPSGLAAAALVVEALADAPTRLRTRIALTYSATTHGTQPRRTSRELAVVLGARLPGLCVSLQRAGVAAVPLTAHQLTVAVRTAYDPSVAALLDRSDPSAGPDWRDVGPSSSQDRWDHFRHDGACSVSWVASRSPRDHTPPRQSGTLLSLPKQVAAQRLAFLYRPTAGGAPGGDALAPFATVATATVRRADDLPHAVAVKQGLAAAVRVRLRRAFGSQAGTFAAGLPLGIASGDALKPPQVIRATGA